MAEANGQHSSQFCDAGIDRLMRKALAEELTDPTASRALWQRVDREITDAAPWVPLIASKNVSVLSKRVGNYQYSPAAVTYTWLDGQLRSLEASLHDDRHEAAGLARELALAAVSPRRILDPSDPLALASSLAAFARRRLRTAPAPPLAAAGRQASPSG
ncbi:MAG: hypothetical protein ACXVRI_02690 [Gaiellaceae bacterium]